MHLFFSIPVETRQAELLTALHFVLHLRLNVARKGSHLFVHLLAFINRGYVFRMFTLLCTCAYLLSLQMALTLQNAHQKKMEDATLGGINLNGGISSPGWMQQKEETQPSVIRQRLESFTCHRGWLTNQSWCDGAPAVSSGVATCEHQGLSCLSLKLKGRLHEKGTGS